MSSELERITQALGDRYTISHEVGSGGMATVYLAQDPRHHRKVAVKVLRPEVAAMLGAERFLSEIRLTASLQHSNILPLYDSGEASGLLYYVMPFVEGESLRERLARDTLLPVDKAVEITRSVAAALEYAHGRGVVHRDIKPENILLQHGQALVADFGIALAISAAGGSRLTETGLSVGTPHYMSPEQAMGERNVDARSDIYSLGVTLFEMLAGRPPFSAATAQGTVAKIMAEQVPSLRLERPVVPPNVESAIAVALAKLPADRFATVQAFADALANPGFVAPWGTGVQPVVAPPLDWRQRIALPALALAGAGLGLAAWLALRPPAADHGSVLRYRVSLPSQQSLQQRYASRIALSPDGTTLVFVGPSTQGVQLWLQSRDQLDPVPIPGTEGAAAPFFSPDGRQVGFLNVGRQSLQAVTLGEGGITTLVPSRVRRVGADWSDDGIVYVDEARGLMRLAAGQTPAEAVVLLDPEQEAEPQWPHALPGGGVLFSRPAAAAAGRRELVILPEAGEQPRTLVAGLVGVHDGRYLVYVTESGELMAARLDLGGGRPEGRPVVLARNLEVQLDAVDLALSERGTLMYGDREGSLRSEVVATDREGTARVLDPEWRENIQTISLSPDGSRLAVTVMDSTGQSMAVWTKPVGRGLAARLTLDPAERSFRGVWHPGGQMIGYMVEEAGTRDFYQRRADGSGGGRISFQHAVNQAEWSPDGQWLIYRTGRVDSLDVFALNVRDSTTIPVAATPGVNEHSGTVSPDGRWVAFVSNRSGVWEVYVRPFPNTANGEWQVSQGGGTEPRWAHRSAELFYKRGERQADMLMAAEVRMTEPAFVVGRRRPLFPVDRYYNYAWHPNYAVGPSDQTFYMIRPLDRGHAFDLIVIEHWQQALTAAP